MAVGWIAPLVPMKPRRGRPPIPASIRERIKQMAGDLPHGRIGEIARTLGLDRATVSRYAK